MNLEDTIVAPATPGGVGAIHVIRISGPKAVWTADRVFDGADLSTADTHTVHYGFIRDGAETIDEVMVSIFRAPRSFTTEDIIEISCHGSPYITSRIVQLLVDRGARPAEAGEFTFRAFLHGRLDLSQAEAVADLISSDSRKSRDMALDQMRGGISDELKRLRGDLVDFAALVELELDFSEEDVEFADRDALIVKADEVRSIIARLRDSFRLGNVFKHGVQLAIVGRPNAGKSSWINALSDDDVAIVSEIAGTTRDKVESSISIGGLRFNLIDTAGLRATGDTIERIGVERAVHALEHADMILHIFDVTETDRHDFLREYEWVMDRNPEAMRIVVGNKIDAIPASDEEVRQAYGHDVNLFFLSAHRRADVDVLKAAMEQIVLEREEAPGDAVVSNARHVAALDKAHDALGEVVTGIRSGQSGDLVAFNLRYAIRYLGEITGEVDIDRDILGTIFGKFCIGK